MLINYEIHRAIIEAHYGDKLTVYEQKRVPDPVKHSSKMQEVAIYSELPCHLGWGTSDTGKALPYAPTTQRISVILAPEPNIPPGSTIEVLTESGRKYRFKSSSPASVVPSHQEIFLEAVGKA